jgi:hypothetical protein
MNFIGHIYFVFVDIFMYSLRPKLLDTFDKNKILRNLWGIYKNAQLVIDPVLNKLSNELFHTENGAINQKIWSFN